MNIIKNQRLKHYQPTTDKYQIDIDPWSTVDHGSPLTMTLMAKDVSANISHDFKAVINHWYQPTLVDHAYLSLVAII